MPRRFTESGSSLNDAPNLWADAAGVAIASLAGLLAAFGVAGLIVLYWGCK